jgi:aryl sulfotransferase
VKSWSANVASWMTQTDVPVHLVRYEDLRRDTAGVFRDAMAFAGATVSLAQAEQAAARADFSTLRAQEAAHGFREWAVLKPSSDARFFRRGEAEGWRDELTAAQIAQVEARHGDMMAMFGYARATAPDPLSHGNSPCA